MKTVMHLPGVPLILTGLALMQVTGVPADRSSAFDEWQGKLSEKVPKEAAKTILATDENAAQPDAQLISANNRFGLELYRELLKEGTNRNMLVSPASIALALEMTWNGAAGQTQTAMAAALQLDGMSKGTVNKANAALLTDLNSGRKGALLTVANSLWASKETDIKPDFIQRIRSVYRAEIGDLTGAPENVNEWVSKQTNGKIKYILSKSDVPKGLTSLILANAVYFKGAWLRPFSPLATKNADFVRLNGSKTVCKLMTNTGQFSYFKGDNFQAVSLPYGEKGPAQISMFLFLPDESYSLARLQSQLTEGNWNLWMQKFAVARGTVELPRFRFECETDLKAPMSMLGMKVAFDPSRADFANMSSKRVFIGAARHKTYINVDEKGTEAAAATAVSIITRAVPSPSPFHIVFDRPFVCAIRDDVTGAILFVGSVVDPIVK